MEEEKALLEGDMLPTQAIDPTIPGSQGESQEMWDQLRELALSEPSTQADAALPKAALAVAGSVQKWTSSDCSVRFIAAMNHSQLQSFMDGFP